MSDTATGTGFICSMPSPGREAVKEPDKDLIATCQPEQRAHEIKLNVVSAPSQINLTIKGSEGKGRKIKRKAASESALVLFTSAFPE